MSIKTITIKRIHDHDIHHGQRVLETLRTEGVPVLGVLWPTGVAGGKLTVEGDVWVCEWEERVEELF